MADQSASFEDVVRPSYTLDEACRLGVIDSVFNMGDPETEDPEEREETLNKLFPGIQPGSGLANYAVDLVIGTQMAQYVHHEAQARYSQSRPAFVNQPEIDQAHRDAIIRTYTRAQRIASGLNLFTVWARGMRDLIENREARCISSLDDALGAMEVKARYYLRDIPSETEREKRLAYVHDLGVLLVSEQEWDHFGLSRLDG
jgi:hypothetical protein